MHTITVMVVAISASTSPPNKLPMITELESLVGDSGDDGDDGDGDGDVRGNTNGEEHIIILIIKPTPTYTI